ncbi:MAG: fasciclin domain-containing protein [Chitinophagaceae bacterium]|nr:MAG: fasciclin domain-containing protein [Chitinophagaceae bacterium]
MLKKTIRLAVTLTMTSFFFNGLVAQEAGQTVVPDNSSLALNVPVVNTPASGARDVLTMASGMADNATLINAIKACGIESGLRSRGSITILAPNNAAFAKLPPGVVEQLMKPENASILSKIIFYHILEGNHSSASIKEAIKTGRGRAEFTTLAGNKIFASIEEGKIRLTDDGNNACFITTGDIKGSNGTVHVLDKVALPR